MLGYVIHHKSYQSEGILADYYRNDPYVWFTRYLWSFCHLKQRPQIKEGMTVLWVSNFEGVYVCDLVFVVGEVLPYKAALKEFRELDSGLAHHHFLLGERYHRDPKVTYVADMRRTYIPQPAVPLEKEVDRIRLEQNLNRRPLSEAWRRPSSPLRIEAMEDLAEFVGRKAVRKLTGAVTLAWNNPELDDTRLARRGHPKQSALVRSTKRKARR